MEKYSLKTFSTVITESIIVGIGLIVLYYLIDYSLQFLNYKFPQYIVLFVSGFIFHILCEYTGINLWYSKEYCKLIKF